MTFAPLDNLIATAQAEGLSGLAPLMMVAGVALLGFVLMMSVRRKLTERGGPQPSARERVSEIRRDAVGRSQVQDVHAAGVEVLEIVRRLAAATENRTQVLEQMIEAADERIERLEHALSACPPGSEPEAARPDAGPGAPVGGPRACDPVLARSSIGAPARIDPLTVEVYRLADLGRSPVEIARELDEQIGKIELILALREPKRSRA